MGQNPAKPTSFFWPTTGFSYYFIHHKLNTTCHGLALG